MELFVEHDAKILNGVVVYGKSMPELSPCLSFIQNYK